MRRAVPKYDVEYTFKFKKGDKTSYVTLTYEGINDKGRYEFYNVKAKSFTSMPFERFSYLHRFNLAEEKPKKRIGIREVPSKLIEVKEIINMSEEQQKLERGLAVMKGLNDAQKQRVSSAIGRSADAFIKDFERFVHAEEGVVDGYVLSEWIEAQSCLGLKIKAL